MSIFEELRVLDDRDEARTLRFASTGLLLWPFVRWLACSAALDQALGLQPAFAVSHRTVQERLRFVGRAALHGPLTAGPFDIVISGSSAGLTFQREGRWFDRINDYFAMEAPARTLVLDRAGPRGYRTPRFPPHVRAYDTFDLIAGARARLSRPRDADLAAIDHLLAFVRARSPVPLAASTLDAVRAQLAHWALRLPTLHSLYARFFDRVQPRLLMVEDGSYGAFSHVLTWARDAGIATAEAQHGVIARSHLAYNLGDAARGDLAFQRAWPQYLLLYGDAWREETRTSSALVTVGCPHFAERAPAASRAETVLVISQGTRTEAMVSLAMAIARRFPARRCVFRLHPGEVPFRERYAALHGVANIEVSDRGDLYELLGAAGIVVGHSSTALVEAAGIGVPVFVLDDPMSRATLPADVGTWFATAEELVERMREPPARPGDPDRFFATGWRDRYRALIEVVSPPR